MKNDKLRRISVQSSGESIYDKDKINNILRHFHNKLGHPGMTQTMFNIQKYHEWENMEKDIQRFVENCIPCTERKKGNKMAFNLKLSFTASEPFEFMCRHN